jgi:hypothetical protein
MVKLAELASTYVKYCFCPRKMEAVQRMRQERGKCTQCMPVYKVSTFQREGPSILIYTPWTFQPPVNV